MHKSRFGKRANVPSDDFSFRNQQICTNIIRIVWIIRYDITKTFDPLSRIFFQIKALLLLNVVILFINIVKNRRNLYFHDFAGFRLHLPAKTFQKMCIRDSPNGKDYYFMEFQSMTDEEIYASLRGYFDKLIQTVQKTDLDVLAHITYPLRYIVGDQGRRVCLDDYENQLHLLLTSVIEKGVSLEVNSSGLRQKIGEPLPNRLILQKYRELGGTMVRCV